MKFMTIKPCRILILGRTTTLLGISIPNPHPPLISPNRLNLREFHGYPKRSQKSLFYWANLSCVQSSASWRRWICTSFSFAPNARHFSTLTGLNDKNSDGINVRGGPNGKALVVEKIDSGANGAVNTEGIEDSEDLEGLEKGKGEAATTYANGPRKESDVEEQAWKLLKDSVVTYCGSPVGTLAANDPNDTMPLNYDQVFIRDFVPAALAFLLKGENEIVKNFLLNNLQLQVIL